MHAFNYIYDFPDMLIYKVLIEWAIELNRFSEVNVRSGEVVYETSLPCWNTDWAITREIIYVSK